MDTASFQYLLKLVTPFIMKENTRMRESISPAERLALTLRHLATGDFLFHIPFFFTPTLNLLFLKCILTHRIPDRQPTDTQKGKKGQNSVN